MKYLVGHRELKEVKSYQEVGGFLDHWILLNHAGEQILLMSGLDYSLEKATQLIASYLRFCGFLKDAEELMTIDREREYDGRKDEKLDQLQRQVKKILDKRSIKIENVWAEAYLDVTLIKDLLGPEAQDCDLRDLVPQKS